MKVPTSGRKVLYASVAALLLAACSGSQPPIGAPGATPQSRAIAAHAERGESWMLPEAKSENLMYVSTGRTVVLVYSYPGGTLVGTLGGFSGAAGECVDASGDVFIANWGASEILEYAHGATKPMLTLTDGSYGPNSCSVDPASGTLAVANLDQATVAIYRNGSGDPTFYSSPDVAEEFCGYDDMGNLFVDGLSTGEQSVLGEFPSGSSAFRRISVSGGTLPFPGPIQWDGSYLALGGTVPDRSTVIYRVVVSGSVANVISSTELTGPGKFRLGEGVEWWIQGQNIIEPFVVRGHGRSSIGFWRYPEGGTPKKAVRYIGDEQLWFVAVSLARRHR